MTARHWMVLSLVFSACYSGNLRAQEPPPADDRPILIVGTKEVAPFAMKNPDGSWRGISIDLWKAIADELDLKYEFREQPLEKLLNGLKTRELDAAVAAMTITTEREEFMDFTHPFYNSGLGIAVSPQTERSWVSGLFSLLLSWEFLQIVAALVVTLLIVGLLVWLFERRHNAEQFGGRGAKGLYSGFWWSAVTMTTVGYGDKAPKTLPGRLVALIWMFSSLIVISFFTASVATMLTVSRLESPIQGPDDLPDVRVATVADSTSEEYLRAHHIPFRAYPEPLDALEAVARNERDAVVYDMPTLRYLSKHELDEPLDVLPRRFDRQNYGIGLPQGSPLRETINRVLLRKISEPEWDDSLFRYLGRL